MTSFWFRLVLETTSAIIFLGLAVKLNSRQVAEAADRQAWKAYVIFWAAIGTQELLSQVSSIVALAGVTDINVHLAFSLLSILLISLALWGLLYFLVYVYSGKTAYYWVLAGFYIAYFIFLIAFTFYRNPTGIELVGPGAAIQYEREVPIVIGLVVLATLVFPQIIAGFMYFLLYFRVKERALKYRVLLVSWSIILWFGLAFLASLFGVSALSYWPFVSSFIALMAVLVSYLAYFPPNWVQHRLNLNSLQEG
jgi:hypothetical protein